MSNKSNINALTAHTNSISVDTVADFKALRGVPVGFKVIIGERGDSTWVAGASGSFGAPDELSVIAGDGVDLQLDEAVVTPEMFGAVGDGVADDTGAVYSAWINAEAELRGTMGKVYRVNRQLPIQSGVKYHGFGAQIIFFDPASSDYHAITSGTDANTSSASNWEIKGWKFTNIYTENGFGEFRRAISVYNDSENWEVSDNEFEDFYWHTFVTSVGSGAANADADGPLVPKRFKINRNKMRRSLGNSIFIIKGPRDFEIKFNDIEDVGGGRLDLGHAILIDFVSASEGSGVNGISPENGWVYKNKISKVRQGFVLCAGAKNITTEENEISESEFYSPTTDSIPINYGTKFGTLSSGAVLRNKIAPVKDSAILVTGETDVIGNKIEDACTVSGTFYIGLGEGWENSVCKDNVITRDAGLNVPALSLRVNGAGENCVIGPNQYPGHVDVISRYLGLNAGVTPPNTLQVVGQQTSGIETLTGDAVATSFSFPHKLGRRAYTAHVTPASSSVSGIGYYVSIVNGGADIQIDFDSAPPVGDFDLMWQAYDVIYEYNA